MQMLDELGDRVHVITRYRELEHWKALMEENKTYTLYNCHVYGNEITFNPFKVVFGSGTKVQKYDKLTTFLLIAFKTDVLYGMGPIFTGESSLQLHRDGPANEVSRTILKGKRKTITLIDDQTQRKYKCRLITAERASYEKYLGGQ
ncbi:hypothetical protein MTR_8g107180 [Medicago truncatula]|uniref:Uncharacterized protein n=1 Tax=Medicago truncatula TaxID=3880 RepID=G7LDD2_MEDTR|nr:hypothetical protein MTR_8g107180 [Medicago truncatula]